MRRDWILRRSLGKSQERYCCLINTQPYRSTKGYTCSCSNCGSELCNQPVNGTRCSPSSVMHGVARPSLFVVFQMMVEECFRNFFRGFHRSWLLVTFLRFV